MYSFIIKINIENVARYGPRLIGNHVSFDVEFHTKLFLEEP